MKIAVFEDDRELVEYLWNLTTQYNYNSPESDYGLSELAKYFND